MSFNVKSLKRSQPTSSDQESSNSTEKKAKIVKANDLKTVMERVNVFLVSIDQNDDVQGDDKKFKKACPIYQKILQERSTDPSLSDEDRELLFSGIRRVILSVEVLFCSSNWDSLSSLFTYLVSNPSLWTPFQMVRVRVCTEEKSWLKRWKDLLTVVKTIDSDDSFQIATLHRTLDSLIVLWDKKKWEVHRMNDRQREHG